MIPQKAYPYGKGLTITVGAIAGKKFEEKVTNFRRQDWLIPVSRTVRSGHVLFKSYTRVIKSAKLVKKLIKK